MIGMTASTCSAFSDCEISCYGWMAIAMA